MPLELTLILLIFTIQWLAFIPAWLLKTESFYDLVGSLTYTLVILIALLFTDYSHWRSLLLTLLIVIWSLRLGMFLFLRTIICYISILRKCNRMR